MAINVSSNSSWPGNKLSNFSPSPFVIDGIGCASAEGFIQALKYPNQEMQRHVCALVGLAAKRRGQKAKRRVQRERKVWWLGREIEFRSQEHMDLIERALRAKFTQNDSARRALLATRDSTLIHETGHKESRHTSLPAREFIRMLYRIRTELRTGS